ncbi:MAG: NADH-quinone oxidoreductase subunit K [Oceanicaulis sp.]|nr:NADH-quinone oxidoreductase subunit K [Oceanicaulis sp.]
MMELLADRASLFALTGAALVALGFYGFIIQRAPIRRLIAFNVIGSGIFLLFGGASYVGGGVDPVPQALIITGIVVALALTAFAATLAVRLAESGGDDADDDGDDDEDRESDR